MYCGNCGKQVENGYFCSECGSRIIQENNNDLINQNIVNVQNSSLNKMRKEDEKSANLLCILSIIFSYAIPIPLSFIGELVPAMMSFAISISGICPLAGLVLMIVARIKYPESKFAKILMWVYIVTIALSMIVFIVFMVSCAIACNDWDTSGCG